MHPDPSLEPSADLDALLASALEAQAAYKRLEKLIRDGLKPQALQDLRKARDLGGELARWEPPPSDLAGRLGETSARLERWVAKQERQRPRLFGRRLREAAEAAGVGCSPLTSDPPEFRLEPLTVALDYRKGVAELRYARLPLLEVELEPEAILEGRRRMVEALEGRGWDAEAWFDRLLEAYRRRLASLGRPVGERVPLVDLLPEVAFLQQPERFCKDPSRDHFQPYGRVRLAYDLARLRRRGMLRRNGMRLSLGSATLGTTRRKDDVLYLEEEGGRGQYYLTAWFVEEGEPRG